MSLAEGISLIIVAALVGLAFWRKDMFLYFIGGPAAIVAGFSWYDFTPTPLGMTVALVTVALGFYMLVRGILKFIEAVK